MTVPTTPALAVQTALYGVLSGDAQLTALISGVWDYVPEDAAYPYVHIGEATEIPDNTHSTWGRQTTHTLHIWTQARGHAQGLTIAARVMQVLDHQPLTISGQHHISTHYEFMQALTDPEPPGDIRHVVMRFRVVTEQAD